MNAVLSDFYFTATCAREFYQADLRIDLGTNLARMADDANLASLGGLKTAEGIHDKLQGFLVEIAEALVDEEAAYGQIIA